MNRLKQFRRGRFGRYAPLTLWLGLIVFLSSGQASMSNTSRIMRPLLVFLFPDITDATLTAVQLYTRKTAHFVLYAVLGLWAARAFSTSKTNPIYKAWFALSLLLIITVASLDETNQSFNNARTGSVYDVLLDAVGGLTALLLFHFYTVIKR